MIQQFHATSQVETNFCFFLIRAQLLIIGIPNILVLLEIEIEIGTCCQINGSELTYSERISQVNGNIQSVLLDFFITHIDSFLREQQSPVYSQADNRQSEFNHRSNKEAGKIVLFKICRHIRKTCFRQVQTALYTKMYLSYNRSCHKHAYGN